MNFIVKGNTFPIKEFLKLCGCVWYDNCKHWITKDANLKKSLRKLKVSDSALKRIHLEKIIENTVDTNSE